MEYTHFIICSNAGYSDVYPIKERSKVLKEYFAMQLLGVQILYIFCIKCKKIMTRDIMIAVEEGRACECCKSYFLDKDGNIFIHPYIATCKDCWSELTPEEKKFRTKANSKTV